MRIVLRVRLKSVQRMIMEETKNEFNKLWLYARYDAGK